MQNTTANYGTSKFIGTFTDSNSVEYRTLPNGQIIRTSARAVEIKRAKRRANREFKLRNK